MGVYTNSISGKKLSGVNTSGLSGPKLNAL